MMSSVLCPIYSFRCAMDEQKKPVGLQGDVLLHNAVPGDADAEQSGSNDTYAAKDRRTF